MSATTAGIAAGRFPRARLPGRRPAAGGRETAACALTLTVAAAAGAAALVVAYRRAEWGQSGQFGWFWAGMLVFTLPAAYWGIRRRTGARLRLAVLTGYACFTYLPKLLRNPSGPLYHDEYAHWAQAHDILLDGRLFEQNSIIRVIGDYPGLHATVAALAALTGLTVWHAALLVLITAHLLVVLGVAVLAGRLWPDPRIGVAAAFLYSLNSSFLFFDTQLGYESIAITLLVWALVAALAAMRSPAGRARAGWSAFTLLLAVATVATHHLTALWLTAILGLLAITGTLPGLRRPTAAARTAWALTAQTGLVVAFWMVVVAPRTSSYLDPYLGRALGQFGGLAGSGSGGRTLFSQSVAPWWERLAAYAAPGLALLALAGAAALWWRRRRTADPLTSAGTAAMLLLGALYFPATLLILTPAGAEGARRSWAFSYLGIAVAAAPLIIAALDRPGRLRVRRGWVRFPQGWVRFPQGWVRFPQGWVRFPRARARRVRTGAVLLAACAVMLVGNNAAGMNPSYRFPGPPVFGSDTRAATPEVLAAAAWLRETQGREARLVADRYSGLIFGSYGEQAPATGSATFPAYDLYRARPGRPISAALLNQLRSWRFEFLVVDRRMAEQVPDIKIYFETNEPIPHDGRPAFTAAQLTKFDTMPWLIKMYDGPNVAIYRFDFGRLP